MKYVIVSVTRTILCYLSPAYNCILNIARKIKNHTYKIIYDFGGSIMIGYKNFDIDPIKILHVYKSFGT